MGRGYDLRLATIDPAYIDGARDNSTSYAPPKGIAALRELLACIESVNVDSVMVTHGASMALSCVVLSLQKKGAVLIPHPYFPAYANVPRLIGREFVTYDVTDSDRVIENIQTAMDRRPVAAVLMNSPGNPLGNVIPDVATCTVLAMTQANGCSLVLDQTYSGLVFPSTPSEPRHLYGGMSGLIRIGSLSKRFGIPGHRLGYIVADPREVDRFTSAHWSLAMSANTHAQIDACDILMDHLRHPDRITRTATALEAACDTALAELSRHEIQTVKPQGGPMLWLSFEQCAGTGSDIVDHCWKAATIAVSPGEDFGVLDVPAIRCSFAIDPMSAVRVFNQLGAVLAGWKQHNWKTI